MDNSTSVKNSNTLPFLKRLEVMHPYQTLMYLSMFGSVLIFIFLLFSWSKAFNNVQGGYFSLPLSMYLNTLLLLATFPITLSLNRFFVTENTRKLRYSIHALLYLLVVFTAIQLFSWKVLASEGIVFNGHASDGYLYVISGAHLLHLLGGIILLLFAEHRIQKAIEDPVSDLIYATDAFEKLRLRLITVYIHFLDIGWLVILVCLHYYSIN